MLVQKTTTDDDDSYDTTTVCEARASSLSALSKHFTTAAFWYNFWYGTMMYYYYATGDTESCPEFIQDWMKCLQAQSSASEKKKAAILESTYIMKAQRELDANRLWELKGKPTW